MISQVLGLAEQISNNINSIETKLIFPWSKLQPGFLPIYSWIFLNNLNLTFKPDIVISCGRKSVYLSIFLKKKYKNIINIHIQNPKTNFKYFDYIVAPKHDNIHNHNIINSVGALHKFNQNIFSKVIDSNFNIPKKNLISIILGGNNQHYNFNLKQIEKLINIIKDIKKNNPLYNFLIIPSRRTTVEMKRFIINNIQDIALMSDENNNPYTYALKYSKLFIVTSDSTSMISECAYTANPIYVFHLPKKRKSKRIDRFHAEFEKLGITRKLIFENKLSFWTYDSLHESKRIASIVKERIIKDLYESK